MNSAALSVKSACDIRGRTMKGVIAEEGRLCDALSTSLFVMGLDRATGYWKQCQDFDMILITEDGEFI